MAIFQTEKNIEKLIEKIPSIIDKIYVIIDDPDKQILELFKSLRDNDKRLEIYVNNTRKGVGNAMRQAIEYALKENYDIFVAIAANGKDDPSQITRLVEPIMSQDYDYVQGSRYLDGGKSENLPFIRKIITKTFPLIWSILNKIKYTEITNGFRAYKLSIFKYRNINIWQDWLDWYQMEYYIHYKVTTGDYKFIEVPVSKIYSKDNPGKHSKIRWKDGWQIISPLLYLKSGIRK